MLKKILVLDKSGMAPTISRRLESEFDCLVEVTRDGSYARKYLESNEVGLSIVNPYKDHGGFVESYVDLVKNYLKEKDIAVIIFSRVLPETLAEKTGLILGVDYDGHIRKPSSPEQFVKCVRGLTEQ